MIWDSVYLMTLFDLTIFLVSMGALIHLLRRRRDFFERGLIRSSTVLVFGLVVIGLFYLAKS